MTKEEAKKYIRDCLDHDEAEKIIEALEQEPCEDAVSRIDLIDRLKIVDKRYGSDFYWEVRKIVDSLSPVKPVRKKGKWLNKNTNGYYFYGKCPNCGERMENN